MQGDTLGETSMSSIFEAPASKPTGSGLKIAIAFGAGVAVTAVVTQLLPADFFIAARTFAKAPAQLASATPAKSTTEPPAAKTETAPPPETSAPAVTTASVAPSVDDPCDRRAWPYTDKNCAEADTNTGAAPAPVRVIPTDKSAATVAAAPTPGETKFVAPENSDNTELKPARAAVPLPPRKTTVAVAPDDAAAPPPPRKTTVAVAPDDAATPPPPSKETTGRAKPANTATTTTRTTRQKPEARDGTRNGTREVARANRQEPEAGLSEARTSSTNRRAVDPDEVDEERHESQGFSVVRRGTLPDGRRVTVYRKVEGDDGVVSEGENYRVRRVLVSPFGDPEGN